MLQVLVWLVAPVLADTPPEASASAEGSGWGAATWGAPLVDDTAGAAPMVSPKPAEPGSGFKFLGLLQTRATYSNVVSTNPYMDGQVLGVLGGTNGTTTGPVCAEDDTGCEESLTLVSEHRAGGFFGYSPPVLDGHATLNAAFEVDFLFGDQSYLIGGNTGGAYGADQVNLQTRRLNGTFNLTPFSGPANPRSGRPAWTHDWTVVAGLQFVGDSPYEVSSSRLDDLTRTGGGLRFFGSEMAGVSLYGRHRDDWGERVRYRLGGYTLYEKGASLNDDVTLWMADVQLQPEGGWHAGAHAWYLRDSAGGQAGLLGTGPSSTLSELQGGPFLDFRGPDDTTLPTMNADIYWFGADGGYNHRLDHGPLGFGGMYVANVGSLLFTEREDAGIFGIHSAGDVRFRYARGKGSVARAEVLWSSADHVGPDGEPDDYGGVITGNSYGIAGAAYATSGTLLLFPDIGAINRQSALVYDIANQGKGLRAGLVSIAYDVVPNKLNLSAWAAHARDDDNTVVGTELGGRLTYEALLFLNVGMAGARVSGTSLPEDPWTVLGTFDWLVF